MIVSQKLCTFVSEISIYIHCRTQYFEMRNGTRLISADDEAAIAAICRSHGWDGPLVYDGEEEGMRW